MNVLLIGSGGREHAIAWKISQSKKLTKLYIAPGNAGTASCGVNVPLQSDNFEEIAAFIIEKGVNMLVVGPEDPLVKGVCDFFRSDSRFTNLLVIGPGKLGASLEGSKEFAKEFMKRNNIPTAGYLSVTKENLEEGLKFIDSISSPYVLKADGLAAGKGVLILESADEARQELKEMLNGKFGAASKKVVIEEFLSGIEMSAFVITDGENYKILPEAKDYKRIGEGDTGLNTGGMGCVSPVPFAGADFLKKVEVRVIKPTIEGIKKEKIPYTGFVFFGLMNCNGEPKVIEYNVRLGDPETEVILPRLKTDLLELFIGAATKKLSSVKVEIDAKTCVTVMLVSGGYPGGYKKGFIIDGLEENEGSLVFHAGTRLNQDKVETNGGRVIAVSSLGDSMNQALELSYKNAAKIRFEGVYYRRDIGADLQKYLSK